MDNKYDIISIGMGPSSIFMSYELLKLNKHKNVLLIEQGKKIENRNCPLESLEKCIKCKPFCNITSGFSGAGAFSDGKLSLYNPDDENIYIGGNLPQYLGNVETKKLIDYTDKIYLDFGADKNLEGIKYKSEINKIKTKAKNEGIELINIPIRHLGTEKAHELYERLENYLEEHNIKMMFETQVIDILVKDNKAYGVKIHNLKTHKETELYADKIVIGVGRKGANWLVSMCEKHNIKTNAGVVDIGVRYELPDAIVKDINKYMYEAKFIARPDPFKDKVRTFCQNPSGFVSSEVYDNNLNLVNGHSYKERKSSNTNLAILVSHHFNHPFNKPIDYGRNVAKNLNELGNENILVQRLGDIYKGKRTWSQELKQNSLEPTLKSAIAGDITFAIGYRTMTDILQFIKQLDKIIPGFANPDNLLYAPEIKFYSNELVINNNFETSIEGLYSIGDGRRTYKRAYDGVLLWCSPC